MAEGFIQGFKMVQDAAAPVLNSIAQGEALKKRLKLEQDIKDDLERDTASKLWGYMHKGNPPAVQDNPSQTPSDFAKTMQNVKTIGTNEFTGNEIRATPEALANPLIQAQLQRKADIVDQVGEDRLGVQGYKQFQNVKTMMNPSGAPSAPPMAPVTPIQAQAPNLSEDDIIGLMRSGQLDDVLSTQRKQEDAANTYQTLVKYGLPEQMARDAAISKVAGADVLNYKAKQDEAARKQEGLANLKRQFGDNPDVLNAIALEEAGIDTGILKLADEREAVKALAEQRRSTIGKNEAQQKRYEALLPYEMQNLQARIGASNANAARSYAGAAKTNASMKYMDPEAYQTVTTVDEAGNRITKKVKRQSAKRLAGSGVANQLRAALTNEDY